MDLPWGLRWWELVPEAVLGAGLALFLATETSAATSAFASGTAIGLMALAAVAWVALRVVLVRWAPWPALRLAVFAAAALGVLAVVVLPAYDDTTVVEALPSAPAPAEAATGAPVPAGGEPTPAGAPTQAPTATAPVPAAPATPGPATSPPAPPATAAPPPPGPVAVRTAAIRGIDHRASGTAVLYRQPDGSGVVGLEGIDIQPGPDYDVYVVPGAGREAPDGGVRLDDLRGNKGTQYYPVPAGTDPSSGPWTVLVWCQTFDVPVAAATLA
ncbi:MAG TPA: DM13 domain-containing protein [Acidimicrobiales bacterium]|nr:DM13 domain-containing protein [Acidimicrobiales bacterium]